MIAVTYSFVYPTHVLDSLANSEISIVQFHLAFRKKKKNYKKLISCTWNTMKKFCYKKIFTCKYVRLVMFSEMYFNHWLRMAVSSQCITPVRAPFKPRTSNAFLLSLSVPNIYLVTYAIIKGTLQIYIKKKFH